MVNARVSTGRPARTPRSSTAVSGRRGSPSNAGLYQVKCALWYRPVGWNNLFRESAGTFSPIYHDGDEAPPYAEVDFSPLLSAP